jgi:hypothetical protein
MPGNPHRAVTCPTRLPLCAQRRSASKESAPFAAAGMDYWNEGSTPFGIKGIRTTTEARKSQRVRRAQRLSASKESAPPNVPPMVSSVLWCSSATPCTLRLSASKESAQRARRRPASAWRRAQAVRQLAETPPVRTVPTTTPHPPGWANFRTACAEIGNSVLLPPESSSRPLSIRGGGDALSRSGAWKLAPTTLSHARSSCRTLRQNWEPQFPHGPCGNCLRGIVAPAAGLL